MQNPENKLTAEEYQKIGPLLRIYMATKNWKGRQMVDYIRQEFGFEVDGPTEESRAEHLMNIANGKNKLTRESTNIEGWRRLIDKLESSYLTDVKKSIYGPKYEDSFSSLEKYNWDSVYDLIDETSKAHSIIFFNTYISISKEEWFDPLIQMHICIQKSIEQKINYLRIQECHTNTDLNKIIKKGEHGHIHSCINNPPIYREFRILFYPKSDADLRGIIENKTKEYFNLCYVAYLHTSLSIQLAIFTLDDWCDLISENKAFFSDSKNLHALKLDTEISELIKNNYNRPNLKQLIIKSLDGQDSMPKKRMSEGIDFLLANNTPLDADATVQTKFDLRGDIWATYYDDTEGSENHGLNYYLLESSEIVDIKKQFTNIIFNLIIQKVFASKTDKHKKLDPIHDFYSKNGKAYWRFTNKHDASLVLNLG